MPPEFEDPGDFLTALQNGAVNDVVDLENEAAFFVEQTNINIPDDKLESVGAKIRKATVKHGQFFLLKRRDV